MINKKGNRYIFLVWFFSFFLDLNSEEKTLNTIHPTEDSGKLLLSSSHDSYDLESRQCSCCLSATSTSTEPKSV